MKWENNTPETSRSDYSLRVGDFAFFVHGSKGNMWQGAVMSFGTFSEESCDSCCLTWPSEMIAMARKKLDELEAKLEEPEHAGREEPANPVVAEAKPG